MDEERSTLGQPLQAPHLSNNWFGPMPKKNTTESQKEQSARFRAEVERLIAGWQTKPHRGR